MRYAKDEMNLLHLIFLCKVKPYDSYFSCSHQCLAYWLLFLTVTPCIRSIYYRMWFVCRTVRMSRLFAQQELVMSYALRLRASVSKKDMEWSMPDQHLTVTWAIHSVPSDWEAWSGPAGESRSHQAGQSDCDDHQSSLWLQWSSIIGLMMPWPDVLQVRCRGQFNEEWPDIVRLHQLSYCTFLLFPVCFQLFCSNGIIYWPILETTDYQYKWCSNPGCQCKE